jgi:hypothetical protein
VTDNNSAVLRGKPAIAEYLGFSQRYVLILINTDPSFPVRLVGKKWSALKSDLDEWFRNQPRPNVKVPTLAGSQTPKAKAAAEKPRLKKTAEYRGK